MIFYAPPSAPEGTARSLKSVRMLVTGALVAYPAGALLRTFGPDQLIVQLGGYALILLAFICAALVVATRYSRVVAGEEGKLDEFELHLRHRAMSGAYVLLSALLVVGIIYLALASDFGLWVPSGHDQWNGMFWAAFLYAALLPTAVLVWSAEADGLDEPEAQA